MRTDFAKKRQEKRSLASRKGIVFAIALTFTLIGAGIFLHHKQLLTLQTLATQTATIRTWWAEHRGHLKKDLKGKVKQLADKNEAEPELHFEFYTALPNMQVKVADPEVADPKPTTKKVSAKKPNKIKVADANEIEKELAKEIKK